MFSAGEIESFSSQSRIANSNGLQNSALNVLPSSSTSSSGSSSRYENQKRRDWNTFGQYLKNHKPPLTLSKCSGAHVLEFLKYLDQFGKTKVHNPLCPFYGHPNPPAPCACPLRQAWGSLDALIGRLRAAFEENGGKPETNPFGARAVRLYLRDVRDLQSKARGISYEKKKRKHHHHHHPLLPPPPQRNIPAIPPPGASC
ncbi:hypothetical protein Nepgr_022731 [Nepenthes gracilis]|uniref:ALOG domain-containing protein n=1 Tax=Nepenthes gracilis TaxID=150966 RepID=A0AAD3T1B0_NEPGR|nr:hypothetical protein Nepgr_022731 [Nepenthes gracilis]